MDKLKIVILDGYSTNPGDATWDAIEQICDVTVYDDTPHEQVYQRAVQADILISNRIKYTSELLASLTKLKMIALLSTGYNLVDCDSARQLGIVVCNAPHYSTDMVAQHTFALILELINQVGLHNSAVKNGNWQSAMRTDFKPLPFIELAGKTLGIIGYGAIGKKVAVIANAFEMNVLCYSRSEKADQNAVLSSLHYLLQNSDIVSVHCPYTEQTKHLINDQALKMMKSTALLINTARGPIIDEKALIAALTSKTITAAALDVLSVEPAKSDNKLLKLDNCIITPHIAWAGVETRQRLIELVADNIRAFLDKKPENVVN